MKVFFKKKKKSKSRTLRVDNVAQFGNEEKEIVSQTTLCGVGTFCHKARKKSLSESFFTFVIFSYRTVAMVSFSLSRSFE